jgi:hypothetical protein
MWGIRKKKVFLGRDIVFLLDDGTYKWTVSPKFGEFKSIITNDDLNEAIIGARKIYGEHYIGAYDVSRFKIDDKEIDIFSKFGYEEIRKMWIEVGSPGKEAYISPEQEVDQLSPVDSKHHMISMMIFTDFSTGFKDEHGRIGSLLDEIYVNLKHDYILYALSGRIKRDRKTIDLWKKGSGQNLINGLSEKDRKTFQKIVSCMM